MPIPALFSGPKQLPWLDVLRGSAIKLIHFMSGGRTTNPLIYSNQNFFAMITDSGWRAFVYPACYTAVCFIPVCLLYRKRIFVKV
jgi:hypothetical protein